MVKTKKMKQFRLIFAPTMRNSIAVKECIVVKKAPSMDDLIQEEFEVPDPMEWTLETIEEL
jgi:hypothetical protein